MPRAATRVASTSFAVASSSRPRGSSLDVLPLVNNSSAHGMFPSPRPSKLFSSSSSSAKIGSSSSSSPSHRRTFNAGEPPHTPPRTTAAASTKRKRVLGEKDENDIPRAKTIKMPERLINTYLANYDLEAENRIRTANQALQVSIESARAQMISGISAFPRNILSMRLEDYLFPPETLSENSKDKKRVSTIPAAKANKTPRAAKPGEVVYSARGSPIYLKALKRGNVAVQVSSEDDEDDGVEEPFFDTASDNKSESSESFSLPDEAAYTAQVMEQERNRIMSSEGYFPRSSSMFHRTSSST